MSVTTNEQGLKASGQEFDPWGNVRAGAVPETTLDYTGQRRDSTGLLYYNARYYDPVSGHFISADTVVPDPTNPQQFNRYSYALNNPVHNTDPDGHCTETGKGDDYCHPSYGNGGGGGGSVESWTDDILSIDDGVGDVYYRSYEVEIAGSKYSQNEYFDLMRNHFGAFANGDTSVFKTNGTALNRGDRIDITGMGLPVGVYVGDISNNSFTLYTAKGHVEAGAIRFSVNTNSAGNLVVRIDSEARAANGAAHNIYDWSFVSGPGRAAQTGVWTNFLSNAVRLSGGRYANISAEGKAVGPLAAKITTSTARTPSYRIAPSKQMLNALSK
ncbi:RHS repeat-associated core domain-containing protein [Chloroflexia bacterium SDU3-3]|nr:RHS repeat-associated core domain-containing protein [Chloroflexia bacterium SDU3-3]